MRNPGVAALRRGPVSKPVETETPGPRGVPVGRFEKAMAALPSRHDFQIAEPYELLDGRIERFRSEGGRVLSFDVFDTLLLRNNESEARRYWQLAEITAQCAHPREPVSPARRLDHYVARNLALELSYRARPSVDGCREGEIREVLAAQARMLGLEPGLAERFHDLEIEYEAGNLVANVPLLSRAADFVRSGGQAILVSDIYLPASDIERLFRALGVDLGFVTRIYSSADRILSKRSGRLFPAIEDDLGIPGGSILHLGDSLESDYRIPKRAGWQGQHYPISDAEQRARFEDLAATIRELSGLGLDAARWAKL